MALTPFKLAGNLGMHLAPTQNYWFTNVISRGLCAFLGSCISLPLSIPTMILALLSCLLLAVAFPCVLGAASLVDVLQGNDVSHAPSI